MQQAVSSVRCPLKSESERPSDSEYRRVIGVTIAQLYSRGCTVAQWFKLRKSLLPRPSPPGFDSLSRCKLRLWACFVYLLIRGSPRAQSTRQDPAHHTVQHGTVVRDVLDLGLGTSGTYCTYASARNAGAMTSILQVGVCWGSFGPSGANQPLRSRFKRETIYLIRCGKNGKSRSAPANGMVT